MEKDEFGGTLVERDSFGGTLVGTGPAPSSGTAASDLGKSIKVGVQKLPGMVTGLADLPIALATGARPFTKTADALGEATGFQPGKWADETKFSQGYEDSKKAVDAAWKDGSAADIAGAYLSNPAYTANQVAESLPSMVVGGMGSKALLGAGRVAGVAADAATGAAAKAATPGIVARAVGEKWAAPVAAGVGEGAVTAGQQMAGYQGEDQQKNAVAALGAGVGTGLIGVGAGRLANKMGLETAETAMAKIGTGAGADVPLSLKRRVLGGMVSEAVLQELPQSAQEQMWQNFADGKPVMEGVARAGTEGALAGGVMGAGANLRGGHAAAVPDNTGPTDSQAPSTPQLGYSPLAGTPTVFPDGSVALGSEAELAHRYAPQPAKSSEAMGIDPAAGPLSKSAALAVDSGAYMPPAGLAPVTVPEPDPVVLQNRVDRGEPASVAQMQEIKKNPEYLRLGPSRSMTEGAPVVFGDLPEGALLGREETIVDGRGNRLKVRYAVVNAGSVIPSHNADGTPVADYEKGLPGYLRVAAGTARTGGLQASYREGIAQQKYAPELANDAHSVEIDGQHVAAMPEPFLVRIMGKEDVTPDMGDRTNIPSTLFMSPKEQAGNDVKRIDVTNLSFDEDGQPTRESLLGFIAATPNMERGNMEDRNGPTRQASDRLMAAVFKQAYQDDELVRMYAQAQDPEARAVLGAVASASGVMANLSNAGEFDVRAAVSDAVKLAVNAKRQGLKLEDVLQNTDFDMNPEAYPVATFLAQNIRTPKRMAEGLRRWGQLALEQARIADENTRQGSLLGPQPTLTRAEIFARLGSEANPTGQAIAPPQSPQSNPNDLQAQQAAPTPGAAERHPTWRKNALQAGRVARALGLDPKDKRLAQIVAEIDAVDAQHAGVAQDGTDLAAGQIDHEWSVFAPETGTLGVPRAQMPQIKSEHRGALVNFLKARGIDNAADEVPANDLKPTQAEFAPGKVKKAREFQGSERSILVSSDGHVVDGHHQWLAKRANGEPIKVIRLRAPIQDVLAQLAKFPSVRTADGATSIQQEQAPEPPPSSDLLGNTPNASQQAAADERASREQKTQAQRNAAPAATEFGLDMVDANNGQVVDPGQGSLLDGAVQPESATGPQTDAQQATPAKPKAGVVNATSSTSPAPKVSRNNTDTENQFKETERAYGGRPAYNRAKEAGKTKLTYGQWVQVRTPNFKAWFGDWEGAHGRTELRGPASTLLTGIEVSQRGGDSIDMAAMRDDARSYAAQQVLGRYTNDRSGITVEVRSIEEALQHRSGPDKIRAIAAIPEIVTGGVVVFDSKNPKRPRERLVILAKKVKIGGQDFFVSAGIRGDANGKLFYDHEMLDVKKAEARLSSQSGTAALPGSTPSSASTHLNDYTIAFMTQEDSASKVVSPDTGEPLAVYHGTAFDFDAFDTDTPKSYHQSKAMFFTSEKDIASEYAAMSHGVYQLVGNEVIRKGGEQVIPVYLNFQNPLVIDAKGNTALVAVSDKRISAAMKAGRDGIIVRNVDHSADPLNTKNHGGDMFIAFRPAQIKSATGNNGNFDPANPDIRFSRTDAPPPPVRGIPAKARMAMFNQLAEGIASRWANAPRIVVATNMDDPAIPKSAREADAKQRSNGASGHAEGFWHEGTVYLLTDNLQSAADAVRVLLHESLGHHGLRGVFGPKLDAVLSKVIELRRDDVLAKAEQYGLNPNNEADLKEAAEEVLATMAQKTPKLPLVRRAIAAIRSWLREYVPTMDSLTLTDDEIIRSYILPARAFVERGGSASDVGASKDAAQNGAMPAALSRAHGGKAFNEGSATVIGTFKNDMPMKAHPDYKAAKGGDMAAALRLVQDLVTPEDLQTAKDQFGQNSVFVPVHAEEASGRNKIPIALAAYYAQSVGAALDPNLLQANRAYHTGADAMQRLIARTEFNGAVVPKQHYVLVDDVTTMGSTLADFAAYIQRNGGEIAGSVVLVNAMRGGKIQVDRKTANQLEARHGEVIRELFGFGPQQLTAPEAQYLIGFRTADELRTRFLKAGRDRGDRLSSKGISKLTDSPGSDSRLSSSPQAGTAPRVSEDSAAPAPGIRFSRTQPTAIESSMGTMTPEQEAAYKRVAGVQKVPTLKERAAAMKANLGLRMKQAMVDQFAPIRDVSQHAYMMARMSKGSDGAIDALLLYGKPFLRDGVLDVNINDGGFAQILAGLKGEHDRFFMWVAAQRGERLKAEGKENLMGDADISALKTLNTGKMHDGTVRMPLYAKALQQLNAFNEAALKVALESGLIDQDAYDLMKDQPYVPFYRLMEDEGGMQGPKFSTGLLNQKAWKKLKGGAQQLNADLLQNSLQNWSHLYAASARNRAAMATMDAAEGLGVAYKVPAQTKGSVKVMRDGMTEHWMVEDPYLLEAVSALNYTASPLMKPLAKMKQLLTWGVTVNPTFKIRNLIRDSISAISQSDLGYNPLANVGKGWKLTASDSQVYASMLASGGIIKFGTQENTDRLRAQVAKLGGVVLDESGLKKFTDQLKSLYDIYAEFGDRAENVNRTALYDQLIKKGHNHAEASFMARDLMDFSMGGSHPAVRFLTQTVPFLNARLQGLYKLGRAAHEDPRKFATVAGAVSLASLALLAAYGDDEDWKKREDWDRDAYWWFKVGDTAFRIPKPFEVGAIGTLAERTAELMFEKEMTDKRFMERVGFMLAQTFALDPVPQAFKPLLDIYANKDSFTGRAIESQADQRLRPQDRYNERTSEVARLLGSWGLPDPAQLIKGDYTGLSPKQIDHLLRGYFSWAATAVTTMTDYTLRPVMDRGERPDMRMRDWFIAGNFVESLPTGSSRYVSQLYEQSHSVQQAYASYQEAIKLGDTDKAAQIQEREGPKLRNRMAYAHATKELTEINAQAKRIEANRLLSGDVKRERLTELELRRGHIAKRLNDMMTG